jgi:hypothetical protein
LNYVYVKYSAALIMLTSTRKRTKLQVFAFKQPNLRTTTGIFLQTQLLYILSIKPLSVLWKLKKLVIEGKIKGRIEVTRRRGRRRKQLLDDLGDRRGLLSFEGGSSRSH